MRFPLLLGSIRAFLARFRRVLTQNNFAFTYAVDYDGTPSSLEGIQDTIYSAAYVASSVPRPRAAVIGVGGGFDILTALHFNAAGDHGNRGVNLARHSPYSRKGFPRLLPALGCRPPRDAGL